MMTWTVWNILFMFLLPMISWSLGDDELISFEIHSTSCSSFSVTPISLGDDKLRSFGIDSTSCSSFSMTLVSLGDNDLGYFGINSSGCSFPVTPVHTFLMHSCLTSGSRKPRMRGITIFHSPLEIPSRSSDHLAASQLLPPILSIQYEPLPNTAIRMDNRNPRFGHRQGYPKWTEDGSLRHIHDGPP
jgi:hypothetical protein